MALPKVIPKAVFQAIAGVWLAASVGLTIYWGASFSGPYASVADAIRERDGTYDVMVAGLVSFLVPFFVGFPLLMVLRLFSQMPSYAEVRAQQPAIFGGAPAVAPDVQALLARVILASRGARMLAFVIDRLLAIAFVLIGIAPAIALQAIAGERAVAGVVILILLGLIPGVFYAWMRDAFDGRSLGRRMLKMQVIDLTTGAGIGAKKSLMRELPLHFALLAIELMLLGQRPDRRRLGDQWAKTIVIVKP